jgi:hypothetical protein
VTNKKEPLQIAGLVEHPELLQPRTSICALGGTDGQALNTSLGAMTTNSPARYDEAANTRGTRELSGSVFRLDEP